jgi:hypothetical protein
LQIIAQKLCKFVLKTQQVTGEPDRDLRCSLQYFEFVQIGEHLEHLTIFHESFPDAQLEHLEHMSIWKPSRFSALVPELTAVAGFPIKIKPVRPIPPGHGPILSANEDRLPSTHEELANRRKSR